MKKIVHSAIITIYHSAIIVFLSASVFGGFTPPPSDPDPGSSTGTTSNKVGYLAFKHDLPTSEEKEAWNDAADGLTRVWTFLGGGTAYIQITNYMRTVSGVVPTMSFWDSTNGTVQVNGSSVQTNIPYMVYSVAEEIAGHISTATNSLYTFLNGSKADRAWHLHTSGTGADVPDGNTWITTPQVIISGGMEFQRTVTSAGAIWILGARGMMAQVGNVSTGAYFRVSDDEGNHMFEISKTSSYDAPVDIDSIHVDGDEVDLEVNVISAAHPTLMYRASLEDGEWDDEPSNVTVTWGGQSGAWT